MPSEIAGVSFCSIVSHFAASFSYLIQKIITNIITQKVIVQRNCSLSVLIGVHKGVTLEDSLAIVVLGARSKLN